MRQLGEKFRDEMNGHWAAQSSGVFQDLHIYQAGTRNELPKFSGNTAKGIDKS
jgi:hypothetical protein